MWKNYLREKGDVAVETSENGEEQKEFTAWLFTK